MRNIYKAKRDYILQVLEPYSDQIDIYGMDSGLHMLIYFKNKPNTQQLIDKAKDYKLHIIPLSNYYFAPSTDHRSDSTIILGYATLSIKQLHAGMQRFIECYLQ